MKPVLFFIMLLVFKNGFAAVNRDASYGVSFNQIDSECGDRQPGGEMQVNKDHLIFKTPESDIDFRINLDSKDMTILGPHHYMRDIEYNSDQYRYTIKNESALKIYKNILLYYAQHDENSCRLKDVAGGLVYAKGVTCKFSYYTNESPVTCTLIRVGAEGSTYKTYSAFIALPKPRMGAGNAKNMLLEIAK